MKSLFIHGLLTLTCLCITQLNAQDLEPRLLSPAPTGGNFAIASYGYSVGNTLKQKPLLSTQFHASYIFKPGVWLAASIGRSFLGETVLNGEEQEDLQNTSRYGLVFSYRLKQHSVLKLGFTSGITARYGANFTSLVLAYQYIWFDKSK